LESDQPTMSVAIGSWAGVESLMRCLTSLESQWEGADVVVAANGPVTAVKERFPTVRFIDGPSGATVFRLRTLAVEAATGRFVAVTEDHAEFGPNWLSALRAAHEAGHPIVGGPVDNGLTRRAFDWALYYCEYGLHMPPVPDGPVPSLSGMNISYERALLDLCQERWEDTFQENEVNDALGAEGHGLHMASDAWVLSYLPMNLGGAMVHLYQGGHHFARYRASQASVRGRIFWVLASPAVPFVLLARISRRVAARDKARLWPLVRGFGYFALVLGAWSVGEAWGYVKGPPALET
jgi:glycosyl transferase family 2